MAPSRRARQRDTRNLLLVGLVAALIIAVIVSFLAVLHRAKVQLVDTDPTTHCPKTGPVAITAILVDKTDSISPVTQLDIRKQLQDYAANIPRYGALYLYTLDENASGLITPIFFRCNPGQASDVDSLTGSKELAQRSFEQDFHGPLQAMLDGLLTNHTSPTSPIMEGVQAAAVEAFGGQQLAKVPKTMVVVSDFEQNSSRLSFYRGDLSVDAASVGLTAPLQGATVDLLFILRPNSGIKPEAKLDAWLRYIDASQGRAGRDVKLAGAN